MSSLEKLKKIGIKKINQETHISVSVLENILEKRFDKIGGRVWVVGFLSILESHYEVSLNSWLEEFDAYQAANGNPAEGNAYHIKELELGIQTQSRSPGFLARLNLKKILISLIVLLLLILAVIFYKAFFKQDLTGYDNTTNAANVLQKQETSSDKQSDAINQDTPKPASTEASQETQETPPGALKDKEMMITPRSELWFRIFDAKTQEKHDKTIKSPIVVSIPADGSLIMFAHKEFDLSYKNGTKKYSGNRPIRFIVENGALKEIKYSEYLKRLDAAQTGLQDAADRMSDSDWRNESKMQGSKPERVR